MENVSLLKHFEKIVELSGVEGFTGSFFEQAGAHLDAASRTLGLSPLQTSLFAHCLNMCDETAISIEDIAKSIKCSKIQLLQYMNEFEELEKRRYIRCSRDFKALLCAMPTYRVPLAVINAVRKGQAYQAERKTNLTLEALMEEMEDLFELRKNSELSYEALVHDLHDLLEDNAALEFTRKIKSWDFPHDELAVLLRFCTLYVINNNDSVGMREIRTMYDNRTGIRNADRKFKDRSWRFMELEYIENVNADGLGDMEHYRLSDKAKDELFGELDGRGRSKNACKDIVRAEDIGAKKLFYNDGEARQITELTALLREENFRAVQKRLSRGGMRGGFACLFYGPPGTGKTETAYQIARETGRDIMCVDISKTKSMWFGESEKRIKRLFDRYRQAVKSSAVTPILFFNEADAVIGTRREFGGASRSRSIDQTENAIQNIILQELENLEGIMIATTNLTANMDRAFERRFLYKIAFSKPEVSVRSSIWRSIIPDLCAAEAEELALRYDFSGGQIENIARKRAVDAILRGIEPPMDKMMALCGEETLKKETGRKIGFCV